MRTTPAGVEDGATLNVLENERSSTVKLFFFVGLAVLAVLLLAAGRYVADGLRWARRSRRAPRASYAY